EGRMPVTRLVDCDTHLFEPPDMWARYVDPADRDVALRIADDDLGYSWLTYRDRRLGLAEPHRPGQVDSIGRDPPRWLSGEHSDFDYYELAEPYSDPAARLKHLDWVGFDAAVLFPNYGILWERDLQNEPRATQANMKAWNRWIVEVASEGGGRLFP